MLGSGPELRPITTEDFASCILLLIKKERLDLLVGVELQSKRASGT